MPSQWETSLHCNDISHWLGAYLDWSLHYISRIICTQNEIRYVLFWLGVNWFYQYSSGSLHRHWGNHEIAPVPVKEPWRIWVNKSYKSPWSRWHNQDKRKQTKLAHNIIELHISWDILYILLVLPQVNIKQGVNSLTTGRHGSYFRSIIFKVILEIDIVCTSHETACKQILQDPINDRSTLAQVMVWCRQAPSHYLHQCWPRSMSPYGVTGLQWVNARYITLSMSA